MRYEALEQFVGTYPGGRPAFARDAGISQGRLSQIIGGERPSPKTALKFHEISRGKIPASDTRPDLWRTPDDVPIAPEQAAE